MVHFRFGRIRLPDTCESAFKASFHSTIFDISMRPVREDQRHRQSFTR